MKFVGGKFCKMNAFPVT